MIYSESEIQSLYNDVKSYMSEKRYRHTVGVCDTAVKIADVLIPECRDIVEVAALLHDVSKEISINDQLDLLRKNNFLLTDGDLSSTGVIHSYTAPFVIASDFPRFADEKVLNAVRNHTLGAPDMSLIDEIIFLSDFIEPGRIYSSCIQLREKVFSSINTRVDFSVDFLHNAVIDSIDYTVFNLISQKKHINEKIILTRNALLSKI